MAITSSNGRAVTSRQFFSRETAVGIDIQTDPSIIWALLTNASDFPRWNSTVISIDGQIGLGEKITLKSTLDPKRAFKLKVKELEPDTKMVWGDGMGTRVYSLKTIGHNLSHFSMVEKIGGPLFPLFAKMIPPFDQAFEQFASDLKKEAESISNTK